MGWGVTPLVCGQQQFSGAAALRGGGRQVLKLCPGFAQLLGLGLRGRGVCAGPRRPIVPCLVRFLVAQQRLVLHGRPTVLVVLRCGRRSQEERGDPAAAREEGRARGGERIRRSEAAASRQVSRLQEAETVVPHGGNGPPRCRGSPADAHICQGAGSGVTHRGV